MAFFISSGSLIYIMYAEHLIHIILFATIEIFFDCWVNWLGGHTPFYNASISFVSVCVCCVDIVECSRVLEIFVKVTIKILSNLSRTQPRRTSFAFLSMESKARES